MNEQIMDQDVKQYTIDLNSPTSTNIQDLQVMNQRKQKKNSKWKLLINSK